MVLRYRRLPLPRVYIKRILSHHIYLFCVWKFLANGLLKPSTGVNGQHSSLCARMISYSSAKHFSPRLELWKLYWHSFVIYRGSGSIATSLESGSLRTHRPIFNILFVRPSKCQPPQTLVLTWVFPWSMAELVCTLSVLVGQGSSETSGLEVENIISCCLSTTHQVHLGGSPNVLHAGN